MEEKTKVFNELCENEEFIAAMKEADSKDDLKDIFVRFGLELTNEEIDYFVALVEKELNAGELTEEDLEPVAGGAKVDQADFWTKVVKNVAAIAKTCWNAGKKFANWEDKITRRK